MLSDEGERERERQRGWMLRQIEEACSLSVGWGEQLILLCRQKNGEKGDQGKG